MDKESFKSALLQHAEQVKKRYKLCKTEEASKTSLILPFFKDVLGYDITDPASFIPEFVSASGARKDQRCDYAIIKNGKPEILIEAKWSGILLDGYESQLYNYFGATSARLGILTNGVIYRFFGDLDSNNRMDICPFCEINMLSLTEKDIDILYGFQYKSYNIEKIISSGTEMKYTAGVMELLKKWFADPDNDFTAFVMNHVYCGKKTAKNVKNFQPIVKQSIDQFLRNIANTTVAPIKKEKQVTNNADENNGIVTTENELEAFHVIRTLLYPCIESNRITYKDCRSYFAILLDGKATKWICRLYPANNALWQIYFPTDNSQKQEKQILSSFDDLCALQNRLISAVKIYL